MNRIKAVNAVNEKELRLGISDIASWHADYLDSPYIYVGGIPFTLTEGDILAVFSQYGFIVDLQLIRDSVTGKSRGFCFLAYTDARSTILAVDNLNGINLCGRFISVDHVKDYKKPKEKKEVNSLGLENEPSPSINEDPAEAMERARRRRRKKRMEQELKEKMCRATSQDKRIQQELLAEERLRLIEKAKKPS